MLDFEPLVLAEIKDLHKQLNKAKEQLHNLRVEKKKDGDPAFRFYDEQPVRSIIVLINENGGKMKRDDLVRELKEGGYEIAKKTEKLIVQHIIRSLKTNIKLGKFIADGDYIDVPR
jgi:hypothetical protein